MLPSHQHVLSTPSKLTAGVRSALGFTLLESLLAIGGLAVLSGVALVAYVNTSTKSGIRNTVEDVRTTAQKIERSWGLLGHYAGVSAIAVRRDNLAPPGWTTTDATLTHAFGGGVGIRPSTVDRYGDAFDVELFDVPPRACMGVVSNLAREVHAAKVGGILVLRRGSDRLDPAELAQACEASDGTLIFTYHPGPLAGSSVSAALVLPPASQPASPPSHPPIDVPVGSVAPIAPAYPGMAVVVGTPPSVAPPLATTRPPGFVPVSVAPLASPPVPVPPLLDRCVPASESRTLGCPSGSTGLHEQTRSLYCGADPAHPEAWAVSYTPGPWTTVRNTCTPATCPGGAPPAWQFTCGGGCDTSPAFAAWFSLLDDAKGAMPPGAPWPSLGSLTYATTYDAQPTRTGESDYMSNSGRCTMDNLGENSARVQRFTDSAGTVSYNTRLDTCGCPPPPPPKDPVRLTASPMCLRTFVYATGQDPAARRLISNLTASADAGWNIVSWNSGGRCMPSGNSCTVNVVCGSGNSNWTISVLGRNATTGQEFTATQQCECISRGL